MTHLSIPLYRLLRWVKIQRKSGSILLDNQQEQAYKGCLSLLKLADKYTPERLEYACKAALERIPSPRYKNIRLILESGNDKTAAPSARSPKTIHDESYALVRGASYYGGGSHEE